MVHPSITRMVCTPDKQKDYFNLEVDFRDGEKISKKLETSELRELIGVVDNALGTKVYPDKLLKDLRS